jgi:ABC-type bacteriocin/lantibiotic exporter with double-glycine peptidase domain
VNPLIILNWFIWKKAIKIMAFVLKSINIVINQKIELELCIMNFLVNKIKKYVLLEVIIEIIGVGCLAIIPFFTKFLIDNFQSLNWVDISYLTLIFASLWGVYLITAYYSQIFSWKCAITFENSLKKMYFNKISTYEYNLFRTKGVGQYISKLSNDITTLEQNFLTPFKALIKSIIAVVIYSVVIINVVNAYFFLILVFLSVISVFIPRILKAKLSDAQQKYLKQVSIYTDRIKDLLQGFSLVNNLTRPRFNHTNGVAVDELSQYRMKYGIRKTFANVLSGSVVSIMDISVFLLVGVMLIIDQITIGAAVACFAYSQSFIDPIREILYDLNAINSTEKIKKEIFDEINQLNETKTIIEGPVKDVVVDNVEYKNDVLVANYNYKFDFGKKYLLLGESGSGKSTLLNILGGLETQYDGLVKFNSKNIKDYSHTQIVSYNSQNNYIFADNFVENVTLFSTYDYNEELLMRVFKVSEQFERVRNSTNCQELSGGEQQIVRYCRQLLENKPIMLLDEAFSAIDHSNRNIILESLLSQKNKLIIYITHDINSDNLAKFDHVLKLEKVHGIVTITERKDKDNNENEIQNSPSHFLAKN